MYKINLKIFRDLWENMYFFIYDRNRYIFCDIKLFYFKLFIEGICDIVLIGIKKRYIIFIYQLLKKISKKGFMKIYVLLCKKFQEDYDGENKFKLLENEKKVV